MNWIALILQIISFRKRFEQSRALLEAGQAVAEKSRRLLFVGIGLYFASIFLIAGIFLAVFDFGQQFEKAEHYYFSGLLLSSLILLITGALIVGVSLFFGLREVEKAPPTPPPAEDRVKTLLEECLSIFLRQLKPRENKGPKA